MSEPSLTWNPRRLREPPVPAWRHPSDVEMGACVSQLAAVIGDEAAALPSWQRRCALSEIGDELLLLVDAPKLWISSGDSAYDYAPEPGARLEAWLAFEPIALPASTAIALLAGSESPEACLERRRGIVRRRDDLRAQKKAEADAKATEEAKIKAAAEERRVRWREVQWNALGDAGQLAMALSLKLESRDPALAADLRSVALEPLRLPRTQWWLSPENRTE